jgi:homoserine kinase type II
MEIANLWAEWSVSGPWQVARMKGGTNSVIWRADAPDGRSYILRQLSDRTAIPRIRYETALLQALSQKGLPFRLPLPLQAKNGDIIVPFEQDNEAPAMAILYPLLPGSLDDLPPERHDPVRASHAGSALGLLDVALATLPAIPLPNGFEEPSAFGELARVHPYVPDPLTIVERLPVDRERIRQIQAFLASVIESVPRLYSALPQHLLHRDYDPGNILMEQRVTSILDFEFAGRDIRILELCVALSWWPVRLMGTGQEWALMDAFATAYTQHITLSEDELLAIPEVLRLRDAVSFVHRVGRYLAGMESDARIQDRVEHSLWREFWLSANRETLLQHALTWR